MKIVELIDVRGCPSNWRKGPAWAVTFKTDDGGIWELRDVQQLNKPELHHIQAQAETHSEWFWNFGAKKVAISIEQSEIKFANTVSAHGPVRRAHFKGLLLETDADRTWLQVINDKSEAELYDIVDGTAQYKAGYTDLTEAWTDADWAAVEAAL